MQPQRVLVVDDEAGLRMTLGANLELDGFEVVEAESGEHALELARGQRFDLVISDIRMPGIDGVQLFERLRALLPSVPVVLMTAFAVEALVRRALEQGAFALLPKPFDVPHAIALARRATSLPVVLVVDDLPAVGESLTLALAASGLRVRAAVDGPSAEAVLAELNVDVCVVDMVLGGGSDGVAVAQRLKDLAPRLTVIAMSGHEVPDLVNRMSAVGMRVFLRKPFRPEELIRVIAQARGEMR